MEDRSPGPELTGRPAVPELTGDPAVPELTGRPAVPELTGRPAVPELVEHLFRREYARLVAGLVRVLGPGRLELAEDVVQDALHRALRTWPIAGVPDDPAAWLIAVAKNRALDAVRRARVEREKEPEIVQWADERRGCDEESDDALRLVFACCHPELPFEARVALTLKTACGFSVAEIARALLASEESIAQRLVRARRRLAELGGGLAGEEARIQPDRIDAALEVLYLLFNEGYRAGSGDAVVRAELVVEAIRLAELLALRIEHGRPRVHALLALMRFQGARLPARTAPDGSILTLARQDRTRWDRTGLARAWKHFELSAAGRELSAYHAEAAIAAAHAAAPSYEATDWTAILEQYELLSTLAPSPIVALNRAVALSKLAGVEAALAELDRLAEAPGLAGYFLLHATRGLFLWHRGDREAAARELRWALETSCSEPERRLVLHRIGAIERGEAPEDF